MFSSRKSAAPAAAGGYTLTKSLRFRSSASAYLNRTPASAGNRQKWTWSGWVKRGKLGALQMVFWAGSSSTDTGIYFNSDDTLYINGNNTTLRVTSQVFRDPSAWYHIVVALDTTQATAANRVLLYVNGVQVTSFSTSNNPTLNDSYAINNNVLHYIAEYVSGGSYYFDGYMAEVNFIDGQQLTPSSFGATSATTGVWQPIAYTGTYGTNGFYLKFDNLTSTSTLGNDSSGNSNTWTVNNISLTSGSTYDSMTDVPTLTSATAANYCVLNPLVTPATTTIINGNLGMSGYTAYSSATGTMGVSSGKWYFEFIAQANAMSGITGTPNGSFYPGQASNAYAWDSANTTKYSNNTSASYGAATSAGDIVGVAFDLDSGSITFYKNNVSQGTAYTFTPSGTYFPVVRNSDTTNTSINFGQRPFSYTPPTGYVALNTFNLPTPTIGATASTQANKYFDATLFSSTGSSQSITNAAGFKPDFIWQKNRTSAQNHYLVDSVRGVANILYSDSTSAEGSAPAFVTAINSTGWTQNGNGVYTNGNNIVGWQWQAGQGTTSSNTAGSITSTVSANTTAGFSIVTYTGTGANATVGHGLGVAPSMVIVKSRVNAYDWVVYNSNIGNTKKLYLNLTDASGTDSTAWNNTSATSSVFSLGSNVGVNQSSSTYVAYCFAQVAGYSAFGSYTGNGSSDGPFVFTGFRPRYLMVKRTDSTGGWFLVDTARNPYNIANLDLFANTSDAEAVSNNIDILSNGFRPTDTNTGTNASGGTYIYAAFAESPFKYANAR